MCSEAVTFFFLTVQNMFHSESVALEEIYSYVLRHQYYIERILG